MRVKIKRCLRTSVEVIVAIGEVAVAVSIRSSRVAAVVVVVVVDRYGMSCNIQQ